MRQSKGPRLYLRSYSDRPSTWIIRDGKKQIYTGQSEPERELAEDRLRTYVAGTYGARPPDICPETAALLHATRPGFVYFITCDKPLFPVKIGYAVNVNFRIRCLQCALPWPVMLLFKTPGDREEERRIHARFDRLRMNGEWFARGHELLEFIERAKSVAATHSLDQKQGKPRIKRQPLASDVA